jgi:hypothetical protein
MIKKLSVSIAVPSILFVFLMVSISFAASNLIVVRASDDSLWKATCEGSACTGYTSFPGRFRQQPTVTWDATLMEWVIVGVASDNTIWRATFDDLGNFNNDWASIPGSTPSPVGMSGLFDGDITSVTAGTGLSGGGTSGDVTVNVNTNTIQSRVSGTCSAGSSVRTINADGSVVCETDDNSGGTITGVTAGNGLTGGGTSGGVTLNIGSGTGITVGADAISVDTTAIQSRVTGTCPSGQSMTAVSIAGNVACDSFIQNQNSSPQSASIYINGSARTAGLLRIGNEAGTTDPPSYPNGGLVVRKVSSLLSTNGNNVARAGGFYLNRDGTSAGLRIVNVDGGERSIACMGVKSDGSQLNKVINLVDGGSMALYSDADNMVLVNCSFGYPYGDHEITQVYLQRKVGDWYWIGYLISTTNQ